MEMESRINGLFNSFFVAVRSIFLFKDKVAQQAADNYLMMRHKTKPNSLT